MLFRSVKPVEKIIAEIRRIKELWPHPFIEFADDNSFVTRPHAKELLTALKAENVKWFTEADVSIAEDPELLDLMRESGCRQVLVGLDLFMRRAKGAQVGKAFAKGVGLARSLYEIRRLLGLMCKLREFRLDGPQLREIRPGALRLEDQDSPEGADRPAHECVGGEGRLPLGIGVSL